MFGTLRGFDSLSQFKAVNQTALLCLIKNLETMTDEELKKLTVLKQDIDQLRKVYDVMKNHKVCIYWPGYDKYLSYPLNKIFDSENQVTYLLKEMLDEKLTELEDKFNHLTVCNQVTGGPTYYPANLE